MPETSTGITDFSADLAAYLGTCSAHTRLQLEVGFGVKNLQDIDFMRGKADIAVVGSETIRVMEQESVAAVKPFIQRLTSKVHA